MKYRTIRCDMTWIANQSEERLYFLPQALWLFPDRVVNATESCIVRKLADVSQWQDLTAK